MHLRIPLASRRCRRAQCSSASPQCCFVQWTRGQATIVRSRSRVIIRTSKLTLDSRSRDALGSCRVWRFVDVHAVRHHFRACTGHLQVVIWLTGSGAARLPTAVSQALRTPFFALLTRTTYGVRWWMLSFIRLEDQQYSQPDRDGQTQCCSRETVDRLTSSVC